MRRGGDARRDQRADPAQEGEFQDPRADLRRELLALRGLGFWLALSMTVFFAASMFALFTYVAPLLQEVTGVSPRGVTGTLLLIGLGLTLGNFIGGRLAD